MAECIRSIAWSMSPEKQGTAGRQASGREDWRHLLRAADGPELRLLSDKNSPGSLTVHLYPTR
jgi:hypothetical protein